MQNILLTGATGFLGSHLLESYVKQGYNITILKRSTSNTWRIAHLLTKVKSYDIDQIALETVFKEIKPNIIVHTACSYARNNDSLTDTINSNIVLGLNLIEEGIKYNVKTFINTSSLLPKNINAYSLSKHHFSEWLKFYSDKLQIIDLRIEHMYGVNDDSKKFVPWLINEMIMKDSPINLTTGRQKRDFIYIEDIVEAYNLVMDQSPNLQNWNQYDVGTGNFVEVKEFILSIANEIEKKINKDIIARLEFGVIPYRKGDVMIPELDNSKILNLGWKPKFSIKQGIKKLLN